MLGLNNSYNLAYYMVTLHALLFSIFMYFRVTKKIPIFNIIYDMKITLINYLYSYNTMKIIIIKSINMINNYNIIN